MAESDGPHAMPLPAAVGLIIQHAENMLNDEPTSKRCHEFLIEIASILLMVEGFYDVVEKPDERLMTRNRQMPRNIQRSMNDMAERLEKIDAMAEKRHAKTH